MEKQHAELTMFKRYAIFIDTLNLLILPIKEIGARHLSAVSSKLEELEGDYYTFLHEDNVQALVASGHLSIELIAPIAQIRKQIDEIEADLWNSLDFIDSAKWQQVRQLVLDLFKEEKVNFA